MVQLTLAVTHLQLVIPYGLIISIKQVTPKDYDNITGIACTRILVKDVDYIQTFFVNETPSFIVDKINNQCNPCTLNEESQSYV